MFQKSPFSTLVVEKHKNILFIYVHKIKQYMYMIIKRTYRTVLKLRLKVKLKYWFILKIVHIYWGTHTWFLHAVFIHSCYWTRMWRRRSPLHVVHRRGWMVENVIKFSLYECYCSRLQYWQVILLTLLVCLHWTLQSACSGRHSGPCSNTASTWAMVGCLLQGIHQIIVLQACIGRW